jgi:hypothetical protein
MAYITAPGHSCGAHQQRQTACADDDALHLLQDPHADRRRWTCGSQAGILKAAGWWSCVAGPPDPAPAAGGTAGLGARWVIGDVGEAVQQTCGCAVVILCTTARSMPVEGSTEVRTITHGPSDCKAALPCLQ